jgi:hypothetical protein
MSPEVRIYYVLTGMERYMFKDMIYISLIPFLHTVSEKESSSI